MSVGTPGALVLAGLALPVIALAAAPTFLAADRAELAMGRELRVIRAVRMFRPLSGPVLERLAADAVPRRVEAGHDVVRAGDRGDRFYVIVDGRAEVRVEDTATRTIGAGESFGEIALLHDIPRTATVTAIDDTDLLAIERDAFLAALTGQPRSRAIAQRIVTGHLAHDPVGRRAPPVDRHAGVDTGRDS